MTSVPVLKDLIGSPGFFESNGRFPFSELHQMAQLVPEKTDCSADDSDKGDQDGVEKEHNDEGYSGEEDWEDEANLVEDGDWNGKEGSDNEDEDHNDDEDKNGEDKDENGEPNSSLLDLIATVESSLSAGHSFLHQHDLLLLPSHCLSLESALSSSYLSVSKLSSRLSHPIKTGIPRSISTSHHHSVSTSAYYNIDKCWFHRFLLSTTDDYDLRWLETFRMSKPIFSLLLSTLSPSLHSTLPSIPASYALAAALFRLAHAPSYAAVGQRFGLTTSDACQAFYTVCKVICDKLGHFLCEFRCELENIAVGFGWITLPNCCGVLGVERFPIEGTLLGADGYLMVQTLVDSEGRFLDVSAGWPSTMTPHCILKQTKLFSSVEESKELLNGPIFELEDGNSVPQYVLGASCYPLLPWLLTPYVAGSISNGKGLTSAQRAFNDVHRRALGLVKSAFGKVRANWQLLNRRWKGDFTEFLPFVIVTGCILNNFLIKHGETLPNDEGDEIYVEKVNEVCDSGVVNEKAEHIRDIIAIRLHRLRHRR